LERRKGIREKEGKREKGKEGKRELERRTGKEINEKGVNRDWREVKERIREKEENGIGENEGYFKEGRKKGTSEKERNREWSIHM
jgi:hypothetical protein